MSHRGNCTQLYRLTGVKVGLGSVAQQLARHPTVRRGGDVGPSPAMGAIPDAPGVVLWIATVHTELLRDRHHSRVVIQHSANRSFVSVCALCERSMVVGGSRGACATARHA